MIAVSTLLKSCATPPASWPMACIFWAWTKLSCKVRCSVVSSAKTFTVASSPACEPPLDMNSLTERSSEPASEASTGAMSLCPITAAATAACRAGRSPSWTAA